MPKIKEIKAREILDSRGNPTVEVRVLLDNGVKSRAMVPSGASTGSHEALELRDGDRHRYNGLGVLKACANVNGPIAKKLRGFDVTKQRQIDQMMIELDGTANKSRLGANAILGVSLACVQTGSRAKGVGPYKYLRGVFNIREKNFKMPLAMMNIVNGGRHADNTIATQEFMIIPKAKKFSDQVRIGAEIFHTLRNVLVKAKQGGLVGDEGGYAPDIEFLADGFAPSLEEDELAFKLIIDAIKQAGYIPGKNVFLAIDVAASELLVPGKGYDFDFKQKSRGKRIKSYQQVVSMYQSWMKKYPIISIEDPFGEDQWNEWADFTAKFSKKIQIIGDDLFVTSIERLGQGIQWGVANAILIKPNQIGTVSETMDAINLARQHGYKVIISHRSGETTDTTIADLAVAVNADYIKTGSLSRGERVAKYNRLMEIEEELK